MSWLRKSLTIFSALVIGAGLLAATKDDKAKESAKTEKKDGGKKKDKGKATPAPDDKSAKMSVPLPVGHDAKQLTIPYRDGEGKMQMRFVMAVGKRIDPDHMEMTKLLIETFDDGGEKEMSIDLPNSMLDLNTRVISTNSGVVIKRSDFELTGQTMEFNTESKQGRLGGKVHMKIYNLEDETTPKPEEKPSAK